MAVDFSKLPSILPIKVRRVTEDGLPTKYTLDWEQLQRDFFKNTVTDLDRRITTLESSMGNAFARITTEETTRASADAAMAQRATTIEAGLDDANARITQVDTASVTRDSAFAQRTTVLEASLGDAFARITTVDLASVTRDTALASRTSVTEAGIADANARITTVDQASVTRDTALASRTSVTEAGIADAQARITTVDSASATRDAALSQRVSVTEVSLNNVSATLSAVDTASVTRDNALASRMTTAEATLNGNTASISTLQQAVSGPNGLSARYTVVGNINGSTGGYELAGIQRADGTGPVWSFDIFANTRIHGSLVVDGTISSNELGSASVSNAKLVDSAVSNPKILDNAVSNSSAVVGFVGSGGAVSNSITVRAGARVEVEVKFIPYDATGLTGPSSNVAGTFRLHPIYLNGGLYDYAYASDMVVQAQFGGVSGGISVYQFTLLPTGTSYATVLILGAGTNSVTAVNGSPGNMRIQITLTELSK
jgi:hypothetical protein